jgi:hypothetical protein
MSGKLAIFYPNWSKSFDIPNDATEPVVKAAIKKHLKKLEEEKK